MLNDKNKKMCWEVLARFGCENQMNMAIEECAELLDVMVVCQQMFLAMRMDTDEINNRAKAKLERALA